MRIEIERRDGADTPPYLQRFDYEPEQAGESVATALTRLNERPDLRDAEGNPALPIRWEHSCLQERCGACAMVINGRPGLACAARLDTYKRTVRLAPLKKFPVVADLIVDRRALFDDLAALRQWLDEAAEVTDRTWALAYESSRCLQCGCCLEVCPNFAPDGAFFGMAAAMPMARVLASLPDEERRRLYREHIYAGCGKSLACRDICPAGIDVESLLARSNAAALWWHGKRKGNHHGT